MTDCRLLIDPPAPGAWNMAVDEVLLEWAAQNDRCCWRFYRWSEPTLSLGYFQTHEDRLRHPASRNCPVVRRASGGGAILHDAELTYSVVVPGGHPLALKRRTLYEAVHSTLLEVLEQLGVHASLCGLRNLEQAQGRPFLCFQRRSDGDVVIGDFKIAGSAQRRKRGAVLQHGSVLLSRSAAAPELEGVNHFLADNLNSDRLTEQWLPYIAHRLQLTWYEQPLNQAERRRAERLSRSKYGAAALTIHRGVSVHHGLLESF
jgi:lipoate-protein ligase A